MGTRLRSRRCLLDCKRRRLGATVLPADLPVPGGLCQPPKSKSGGEEMPVNQPRSTCTAADYEPSSGRGRPCPWPGRLITCPLSAETCLHCWVPATSCMFSTSLKRFRSRFHDSRGCGLVESLQRGAVVCPIEQVGAHALLLLASVSLPWCIVMCPVCVLLLH